MDLIGRPLPGRASIVLTRDPAWQAEGAIAVADLRLLLPPQRTGFRQRPKLPQRHHPVRWRPDL